jgi:hypothetical protein
MTELHGDGIRGPAARQWLAALIADPRGYVGGPAEVFPSAPEPASADACWRSSGPGNAFRARSVPGLRYEAGPRRGGGHGAREVTTR